MKTAKIMCRESLYIYGIHCYTLDSWPSPPGKMWTPSHRHYWLLACLRLLQDCLKILSESAPGMGRSRVHPCCNRQPQNLHFHCWLCSHVIVLLSNSSTTVANASEMSNVYTFETTLFRWEHLCINSPFQWNKVASLSLIAGKGGTWQQQLACICFSRCIESKGERDKHALQYYLMNFFNICHNHEIHSSIMPVIDIHVVGQTLSLLSSRHVYTFSTHQSITIHSLLQNSCPN